jgi:hypothetical protein
VAVFRSNSRKLLIVLLGLPYKQEVAGSSPALPTNNLILLKSFQRLIRFLLRLTLIWTEPPKLRGAVDNAVNLARCKSSFRQLPVVGRIAYPMGAKVTMHVRLGCKSLSCPVGEPVAVGTTREASKLGGLNIKE